MIRHKVRGRRSVRRIEVRRALEPLEPRTLMAVFTVNSADDILNPSAGVVTLRSAIKAANTTPGPNVINLPLAGTYKVTTVGTGVDNAAGEFAIADSGDLTIQNTSGGIVTVDGGGLNRVFDVDPAASVMPFTVTFRGLVIQGGVQGGDGAGIRASGAASVTLDHSSLVNNLSLTDGGGIAMEAASTGTLTLLGARVLSNRSLASGGGIAARGTGAVVIGSQSEIAGNFSYNNDGGGIWLAGTAPLAIVGAKIHDNRAINGIGGGVANNAAGSVAISGSIIEDNSAKTGGGYADAGTGPLTIANSFVLNNAAGTFGGGGIDAGGPSITLVNTSVSGNSAVTGGGLHLHGTGTTRITDCSIAGNGGDGAGGIADEATKLIVTGTTFASNRALGNGGAIAAFGTVGDVAISNSLFRDNQTFVSGGALFFIAGTLEVVASRFTGNASQTGGAVNLNVPSFSIVSSTFDANRALTAGALILSLTGTGNALTNDTFTANAAQKDGAIFVSGVANATLTMIDDTVDGNTATATSGGVEQLSGTLVVQGTILARNTAAGAPSDYTYTGGTLTDNGGNLLGSTAGTGNKFGNGTQVVVGDPKLGPLEDNGGPSAGSPSDSQVVPTQALYPGSPAFSTGLATGAPTTDERGFARRPSPSIGSYQPLYSATAPANAVFVEDLYETLLGRSGDQAGLAAGFNFLNGGGTPTALTQVFQASNEFLGREANRIVRRYLDRTPSPTEVKNVVAYLASGHTPEQAGAIFIGSSEFANDYGNNQDVFIEGLYQTTLGRAAGARRGRRLGPGAGRRPGATSAGEPLPLLGRLLD